MDPLTQKLLERTRARREDLAKKMAENKIEPQKRKAPLAPNSSLNTEEPSKNNSQMAKSVTFEETTSDSSVKSSMKSRFNMLASQRAQWDVQNEGKDVDGSPVLPTLKSQQAQDHQLEKQQTSSTEQPVPASRKSRFAALAANINAWEDDTDHPKAEIHKEERPVKKWQRPAPPEPQEESRPTPVKRTTSSEVNKSKTVQQIKPRSPIKKSIRETTVVNERVSRQTVTTENQSRPLPSTMSRAARYQLGSSRLGDDQFQMATSRNVVTTKAMKCSGVNNHSQNHTEPKPSPRTLATHEKDTAEKSESSKRVIQEKSPSPKKRPGQELETVVKQKKQATGTTFALAKNTPKTSTPTHGTPENVSSPTRVEPRVGAMAKSIQDRLKAHQSNWQTNEISRKIQEDRMKDMAVLKRRWAGAGGVVHNIQEQKQEEEGDDTTQDDSNQEDESIEDSEEEEGQMYMETDIDNVPEKPAIEMETEVAQSIDEEKEDEKEQDEADEDADDEDESDVNLTDVLGDIDELIVEAEKAMKEEQEKAKNGAPPKTEVSATVEKPREAEQSHQQLPVPPSRSTRSNSTNSAQAPRPVASERRPVPQQVRVQPKQRIVREEQVRKNQQQQQRDERKNQQQSSNAAKIQALMNEVSAQQSIINQTSQALSLISTNESLRNTVEEIEAEKMMVISNQKRQACLAEIQFLKNAPIPEPVFTSDGEEIIPSKGKLFIKDIRLPFKTEYIMDLESDREMPSHYYFIISRCGANVMSSNLLNTRQHLTGDCLKFDTEIVINDLESDFSIELLVYQMRSSVSRVEGMAERAKIQNSAPTKHSRFGSLTPKKLLTNKNSAKNQSSRGSAAQGQGSNRPVRSSSFGLVGTGRLTLASCGTSKFMLSRVPLTSPLEGSIHLCLTCQKNSSIVQKGFLTMFDEISGFGSWHRRWCALAEGYITFWKYPDDERRKPPIGSIDLRECITKEITQISRILCARPNTFELVTQRPATRYEKDTLISTCNNSMFTTKHMLSADVKEERIEWIDALNKTLADLRMWNKDAAAPTE